LFLEFPPTSLDFLTLPSTATSRFCSDRCALLLIEACLLPRRPGIGRTLQRHPFSGLVSVQLGTVTRLPVHPASPVLHTKNGPLGAPDSVGWLNKAATPSYLFKF
ncbi:unnamed protein product, partial [Brassica rapa subsp. trilocularis]